MIAAFGWLCDRKDAWKRARVVTDSMSTVMSLEGWKCDGPDWLAVKANSLLVDMAGEGREITVTWVPSHCGLTGNDWADELAAKGGKSNQAGVLWLNKVGHKRVARKLDPRPWSHDRSRRVYEGGVRSRVEREWPRKEAVSYSRFRSGHSLELAAYRVRLGLEERDTCWRCEEAAEDTEHVVQCPAGYGRRSRHGLTEGIGDLCGKPLEMLAYWKWFRRKADGTS